MPWQGEIAVAIAKVIRHARALEDARLCTALMSMERRDWAGLHLVEEPDLFGVRRGPHGEHLIYCEPAAVASTWPRSSSSEHPLDHDLVASVLAGRNP